MDLGLGMYHHFHILRLEIEQPTGFYYFEAFVHKSCRINGNPPPHLPRRVIQSLLWGYPRHLSPRGFSEGPPRGRQDKPGDFIAPAGTQALVRSIMLAIYRDQLGARCAHRADHVLATSD